MKEIIEYTSLRIKGQENEKTINNLLKMGWQPYGYPYLFEGDAWQVMVKYEDAEHSTYRHSF